MLVVHSTPLILWIKCDVERQSSLLAVVSVDISYFGIVEPWRYDVSLEKSRLFFAKSDFLLNTFKLNCIHYIQIIFFVKFFSTFFHTFFKQQKISIQNWFFKTRLLSHKSLSFDFFDFVYIFTVEIFIHKLNHIDSIIVNRSYDNNEA